MYSSLFVVILELTNGQAFNINEQHNSSILNWEHSPSVKYIKAKFLVYLFRKSSDMEYQK